MFWKKEKPVQSAHDSTFVILSDLLSNPDMREDFLGVKSAYLPTPEKIISDAANLQKYANSADYKVFAKEVWARSLKHLDAILAPDTSADKLAYHRGALSSNLDLLRLSYQARSMQLMLEKEKESASLQR